MPTATKPRFSPSRALGIPPKDYNAYFSEDDAVPVFNPDRGYSAAPQMVTPFDAYANQFDEFGAKQGLANLDAQKDILSGKTDFTSPEGRAKGLDYTLRGVISPMQATAINRMSTPPRPPSINKYSPVPADVVKATSALDYIDPTAEDALEQRNQILRELDEHPEYGFSNVKAHPHFTTKDQNLMRNILAAKQHREINQKAESKKTNLSAFEARLLEDAQYDPKSLAPLVRDLMAEGRHVPDRYKEAAGLAAPAPIAAPQAPAVAANDRVQVNTREEYDALPSGTKAIDGKGRLFTKK